MLCIMVLFHRSTDKDFKNFWLYGLTKEYRDGLRLLPIYNRFVSLKPPLLLPFCLLLHDFHGEETGISFTDSTTLAACRNARIHRNRVFKGLAKSGRNTMDWFLASSSICSSPTRASLWPSG